MLPSRSPSRRPCKITYEYDDGVLEEYVLTAVGRVVPSATASPATAAAAPEKADNSSTDTGEEKRLALEGCSHLEGVAQDSDSSSRYRNTNHAHHHLSPCSPTHALVKTKACDEGDGEGSLRACCCELCRPERFKDINNNTNPRIGSPGPVTLFAFGITTCLYNVHVAKICPMNMTTMGLIVFYGGLAQFVGGWFELINKNAFVCTLDVTYGAFWMATAVGNLVPGNGLVASGASHQYMGGFFMLWFFFATTMFVSSLKHGAFAQILLNFCVSLNFLLNLLGHFANSASLQRAAGFEGMVMGSLAVYVGMAFTLREAYGYSILPLLFQKNFKYTEW